VTTLARTAYPRTAGVAGESAVRRATALVTVVMCLVVVSEAGYGAANGGLGEVPMVAALAVLPLLYVVPATRPLWLRHRYLLLAVQATLTYLPFVLHLSISNDGSGDTGSGPLATDGRTGNGLRNLSARLEAAGGDLTATREDGTFSLAVELPLAEDQPVG